MQGKSDLVWSERRKKTDDGLGWLHFGCLHLNDENPNMSERAREPILFQRTRPAEWRTEMENHKRKPCFNAFSTDYYTFIKCTPLECSFVARTIIWEGQNKNYILVSG